MDVLERLLIGFSCLRCNTAGIALMDADRLGELSCPGCSIVISLDGVFTPAAIGPFDEIGWSVETGLHQVLEDRKYAIRLYREQAAKEGGPSGQ